MRYGRTSAINFVSKLVMSASGFFATIALTRTLGQERYGTYVVVLSVLSWVVISANLGLNKAVKKRVSESNSGNIVLSGALAQISLYVVVILGLLIARSYLNSYMSTNGTFIIIALLAGKLFGGFVRSVLEGQHLVHISSILSPVEMTSRSILQIILVLSGAGLAGAYIGHLAGAIFSGLVGLYFTAIPRSKPSKQDFRRLKSYAQFSWLASIKSRTFVSMDTIILAAFVSHNVIAIYSVAWNIASLFVLFGRAISQTLFPEFSNISSGEGTLNEVSSLLEKSLAYSGLFAIPGLLGSAIVGDVVLRIYGPGFQAGYQMLLILAFAQLIYIYKTQFLNVIDGVDRPEDTLRINLIFVITNIVLNILLVSQYGWYGAAVATTISAGLGLVLGYYYTIQILEVVVPWREIGKQCIAAIVMSLVVAIGRFLLTDSVPIVLGLIAIGGGVYFLVLVAISKDFRATVHQNIPFDISAIEV